MLLEKNTHYGNNMGLMEKHHRRKRTTNRKKIKWFINTLRFFPIVLAAILTVVVSYHITLYFDLVYGLEHVEELSQKKVLGVVGFFSISFVLVLKMQEILNNGE